jgi:hypothetical protein
VVDVGHEYRVPDGIRYSLLDDCAPDPGAEIGRLIGVSSSAGAPVVEEVLRFEDVPLGSAGSRRAIVRWSDGSESVAVAFYVDEVLFCEGDLVGKTQSQIRSLHFGRDRDWLQS